MSSPKIEPIPLPDFPKLLDSRTYAADWYEHRDPSGTQCGGREAIPS